MAYTQTDLDAINAALINGTLEVEVNGRRVRYRSTSELMRVKTMISKEIAADGGAQPNRMYRVNVCKGI